MTNLTCRWPWWAAMLAKWLDLHGYRRAADFVLERTMRQERTS